MTVIKYIIGVIIVCLLSVTSFAQHDPLFTHHSLTRMKVNPAYTGYVDNFEVKFLHRSQWVGFKDAPVTQLLAVHSPILEKRAGVGFSIINDKFNPKRSTSFFGDGSYKIPISGDRGVLSLGIKAGFNIASVALSELETVEGDDPALSEDVKTKMLPNFGFGFLYKTEIFYLGVSTPRLIQNKYIKGSDFTSLKEKIHFYGITGSRHEISENVVLGQTLSMRLIQGSPVQFQAEGTMILKDKYHTSFMLRTGDAVGIMLGYNVTETVRLGYSYDWSFNNKTFLYNGGSHEIMIKYSIDLPPLKGRNSRY